MEYITESFAITLKHYKPITYPALNHINFYWNLHLLNILESF